MIQGRKNGSKIYADKFVSRIRSAVNADGYAKVGQPAFAFAV